MAEDSVGAETAARITDEGIALMRERIGVIVPQPPPFNRYATVDGFRHFANAYGDDNPLYCDEAYAHGIERWDGIIAPPLFLTTMGVSQVQQIRPELRSRGAHALAGVHEFLAGDEWEWFLPVRPGDTLTKRYYLYDVEEKSRSGFTGSRSVITRYRTDYVNGRGELVAVDRFQFVRAERDAAVKERRYLEIPATHYDDDQLREIDEAYAHEFRRGPQPLYWEDVTVGDDLPALVKGPLTLTDMLVWVRGWGAGINHSRMAWQARQQHPKFFNRNDLGAWDVVERVHWEDAWARQIGNPYAYDFGRMRCCYLSEAVTNWMGDHGWLWKLSGQFRRFNYIGDTTRVKGRVTGKQIEDGYHRVELDVWCENQRGEVSAPGHAVVLLPSRDAGPVQPPVPTTATEGTVPLLY
ncbi:MAG: FAS1-like dehydratase domain-containing protein [Dehalococcoidia bacterium]